MIEVIKKKRKNSRRLSLTIRPDGKVVLSYPYYVAEKTADNFILKNQDFIEKNYQKIFNKNVFYTAINGNQIAILGEIFTIRVFNSLKNKIEISGPYLDLYTKKDTEDENKKIIDKYLFSLSKKIIGNLLIKYENLTGEKVNSFKIKKMIRCEGVCHKNEREIVFSKYLIHKPIDYIEAIVLHEVAHLKYPNHQKEFYNYIESFMPDYKRIIKSLNKKI